MRQFTRSLVIAARPVRAFNVMQDAERWHTITEWYLDFEAQGLKARCG